MLEKLRKILSGYTMAEPDEIMPESFIRDFGLTSFDVMNIVAECEEEFGIQIADRDIRTLQTVSDILQYLEKQQNADADQRA
ncbi:MAG: Acyl carrier protein [Firmicutes bacterium ADurb.Bin182]|nr:MAG: Acyl carrier protein [Firmicutes bacterium ADurb.Bin182]